MKRMRTIICTVFLLCGAFAVQAQITPQQPDSARMIVADTTVAVQPPDSATVSAKTARQPDVVRRRVDSILTATSSDAFFAPTTIFKPSPKKAVLYSVVFPGMGQIYNRKYWKLPILYGGFAAFTYAISWNNRYYQTYFAGYRDMIDGDPATNSWENLLPYGQTAGNVDESWFTGVLNDRKNYYRYYRDFSIIGAVALYGLAIVDAYVDAQLFDFDISPDLSMRVQPVLMRGSGLGNHLGNSYGFQWSFNF